jgi:TolA-binding protein
VVALALGCLPVLPAQQAADPEDLLRVAQEALRDDVPEAAAAKLSRAYTDAATRFGEDGRRRIGERLLEAQVRAGQVEEAIRRSEDPWLRDLPMVRFWRGLALAQAGRVPESIEALTRIAADPSHPCAGEAALSAAALYVRDQQPDEALGILAAVPETAPDAARRMARLRRSELLLALGRPEDAERVLAESPPAEAALDKVWSLRDQFLRAKLDLVRGNAAAAATQLESLLQSGPDTDPTLHDAAFVLLAQSRSRLGRRDEALASLLEFVSLHPESSRLEDAFLELDHLGFFGAPSPLLEQWTGSPHPPLAALALLFGTSARPVADAVAGLREFLQRFPGHAMAPTATLTLAQRLVTEAPGEALRLLESLEILPLRPEQRRYAADLAGRCRFQLGDYTVAATSFRLAGGDTPSVADVWNATVASFHARDLALYEENLGRLRLLPDGTALASDLELDRALFLAAAKHPEALTALKDFAQAHPDHPRALDASLAVAEFHLLEFPPRAIAAQRQLESLRSAPLSPAQSEQADYVGLWIELAAGKPEDAARKGEAFLAAWPSSTRRAEVLMKLGELYFQAGNYPLARQKFERLHRDEPDGPHAETALFFAGRAAMEAQDSKEAIALWAEVIDRGGPLAHEARRQQALSLLRDGNPDDAIRVLDAILRSPSPVSEDLRLAALLNRGQAFLEKSRQVEAAQEPLVAAVAAFDDILDSRSADRFWRNQASVFKAKCLELLDAPDQALETYYEVVATLPTEGLRTEEIPEYDWFYRAGFAAIALLQEQRNWSAAANLAERLGLTRGSRASEAAELANRIRLQHFLWGDLSAP